MACVALANVSRLVVRSPERRHRRGRTVTPTECDTSVAVWGDWISSSCLDINGASIFRQKFRVDGAVYNGVTLEQRMDAAYIKYVGGVISALEMRRILGQLLRHLQVLHAAGKVHGHLTFSDIVIFDTYAKKGTVAILNHGFVHDVGSHLPNEAFFPATREDARSPELLNGNVPTPADDIFAVGCIAAMLLTGKTLFTDAIASRRLQLMQYHFGSKTDPIPRRLPLFARDLTTLSRSGDARGYLPILCFQNMHRPCHSQKTDLELRDAAAFLNSLLAFDGTQRSTATAALQSHFIQAQDRP
jgi:serine/threonine protein kinase